MGERHGIIEMVLLQFLFGYSSTVYLESHGHRNDATAFQISSSKVDDLGPAKLQLHTTTSSQDSQRDDPTLLGVLQLCHPQGHELAGFEGRPPQGLVLDKTFVLVVPARGGKHHSPLEGFPASPTHCRFASLASKSSSSHKVRTYPQLVRDYKQLHRSKSGLNVFDMLPSSERCEGDDVSAFALSRMIKLGEYLAGRYGPLLPALHKPGEDITVASCEPEQDVFQSTSALLHGLLNEKQFARMDVKKLERHVVRGLDSPVGCTAIRDVDAFIKQAYQEEHELFKHGGAGFPQQKHFYHRMGISDYKPAKEIIRSLSHTLCDSDPDSNLCYGGKCLNLTQDNISQLWQVTALHNSYLASSDIFQSYALADTHLYTERLFSWFSVGGKTGHSIKVDVADDYFFLKILASFGHNIQEPILPGARFVIEQYKKGKGKSTAKFWKLMLNGKVVTEDMVTCAGISSNGFCGVDAIKARLKESLERNMFGSCTEHKEEL